MKTSLLLFLLIGVAHFSYSQDSSKISQIDSIVKILKSTHLETKTDTIKQDQPQFGYYGFSIVTISVDQKGLRRYINHVNATIKQGNKDEKIVSDNIFYFNNGELIKVEETATKEDETKAFEYYFDAGKAINTSLLTPKQLSRTEQLLTMGKMILITSKN
jgi:hypothetical protein